MKLNACSDSIEELEGFLSFYFKRSLLKAIEDYRKAFTDATEGKCDASEAIAKRAILKEYETIIADLFIEEK